MTYNPYTKHLNQLPYLLDNSRALKPLDNFASHSKRRRQSLNTRLSKPVSNPQDNILKQKLDGQFIKSIQISINLDKTNLQNNVIDNAKQINHIIQVSSDNQIHAARAWQLETEGVLERSVSLINSMVPRTMIFNPEIDYLPMKAVDSYNGYSSIKLKQLDQLKRVEMLEKEYERQNDLSRLTFNNNRYY